MTEKTVRPYGLWPSPITPASLSKNLALSEPIWDSDGTLIWLERRADRSALVTLPAGGQAARDLNSEYSARGGVGYGGGAYTVGGGKVYFVDSKSGRIYCQPTAGGEPARAITPDFGACSAPALSPDGRWLLYIRSYEGDDSIEIVATDGQSLPVKLVSGNDFYMQPAWHPNGHQMVWIAWNHPNMPWDGTSLWIGDVALAAGQIPTIKGARSLAGGDEISIFQPQFSPDGRLLAYVSDETGWWQLYVRELESGKIQQLTHVPAEHGLPAWVQGMKTYGFSPDGSRIAFLRNQGGGFSLWQLDLHRGEEARIAMEQDYSHLEQISAGAAGIAMVASGSRTPPRLIVHPWPGPGERMLPSRIVRRAGSEELAPTYYSQPEPVTWQTANGETAYGLFYRPHHPHFSGDGLPPLIVMVHGGPTGQSLPAFEAEDQYFTSRGWAVLEVNFRGSSGFGREYRNRLWGNWGVWDVEDAVGGGKYLAGTGQVDPGRMVILGGSSGGYTVLKALEDHPGFFKAGVCLYGISNQFTLAMETHKFEAHYSDRLIGLLPEAAALYRERSPIFFADRIRDPLALFQGEDDTSVPRSQLDAMAAVLRRRGVPHIYHVYPGEGHGFRLPETIEHYYRSVEQFLLQNVIWA